METNTLVMIAIIISILNLALLIAIIIIITIVKRHTKQMKEKIAIEVPKPKPKAPEELIDYLIEAKKAGLPIESARIRLMRSGWGSAQIDAAMEELE